MRGFILDSWPLLAWMQDEQPASQRVRHLLETASRNRMRLWMCILNLGEVYHTIMKTRGTRSARASRRRLMSLPVEIVSVDDDLVWAAADVKARHPVSCADAFCAALARRMAAPVVTGDRDFECLERTGTIVVEWLARGG